MQTQEVQVKPAMSSVTNWAQIAGLIATAATLFKIQLDPEQIVAVIAGIQAAVSLFTIVWKTWFSNSITGAAAKRMK